MSFNASKCQLLTITRKTKPKLHLYTVSDQAIERTSHHKYLDVTISSDLTWKKYIASITSKASSTLGVIRRNLGPCSSNVKLRAYQALVRPQLEYSTAAWNPYAEGDIKLLEAIQRQAVRFICGEYGRYTSITPLLSQLDLDLLATRRLMSQVLFRSEKKKNKVKLINKHDKQPNNTNGAKYRITCLFHFTLIYVCGCQIIPHLYFGQTLTLH